MFYFETTKMTSPKNDTSRKMKKWKTGQIEKMLKSIFVRVGYVARRGLYFMKSGVFWKKCDFLIWTKKFGRTNTFQIKSGTRRSGIEILHRMVCITSQGDWKSYQL